ncbi:DMT family transporter [Marinibaculum pumilum]|uniref:DMT family transporter n=1 Tax=Marinibaculum pumilum TaxID=1766165 RepID=A0ABV7L6G0_9PROT
MGAGLLTTVALVLAVLAGTLIPMQAGLNGRLAQAMGTPIWAAGVSFLIGTLILLPLAALLRSPGQALADLSGVPWWAWFGGLMGACFVSITVFAAPIVGATAMIAAVIAGQLIAALALDHFGLAGYTANPIGWRDLAGVVLLVAGVVVLRFGRG